MMDRMAAPNPPVDRWAAAGAMALTGRAEGPPLRAPGAVVARLNALQVAVGAPLGLDAPALLGERAACAGFTRQGRISCGGASRLLRAADGWVAAALARPDDVAALEAWLAIRAAEDDPWPAVAVAVAKQAAIEGAELGQLLALPVAALGHGPTRPAVVRRRLHGGGRGGGAAGGGAPVGRPPLAAIVVGDLSSLWAGPLCAPLLQVGGADVVKVESVTRPDGARGGPPAFFDLLHAGQRAVALDFRRREDIGVLVELLRA